jgi:hypothetical protein
MTKANKMPRAVIYHPYYIYSDCSEVPEKDLEDMIMYTLQPYHRRCVAGKISKSGFCPIVFKAAMKAKSPAHRQVLMRGVIHIRLLLNEKVHKLAGEDADLLNEVD